MVRRWQLCCLVMVVCYCSFVEARRLDLDLGGFVDAGYQYTKTGGLEEHTFYVSEVEADIRARFWEYLGLRADLNFIPGELLGNDVTASAALSSIIEQGYAEGSFDFDRTFSLSVVLGAFDARFGFERLDPPDMYQVTHSMVFETLQPATLTGVKVNATFVELVGFELYVVNGWNRLIDFNRDKSFGGRIFLSPSWGTFSVSAISGKELEDAEDRRLAVNFNFELTLLQAELMVGGEFGYLREAGANNYGATFTIYGKLLPWLGATGRYEFLSDKDSRLLPSPRGGVTSHAYTVAALFHFVENASCVLEYRGEIQDGSLEVHSAIVDATFSF